MGDKITAKRHREALGIPVVPGSDGGVSDEGEEARVARRSAIRSSSRPPPAAAGAA
jgi:biotin carboxylase